MKPTDDLKDEHEAIGEALSGLKDLASALDKGHDVPLKMLRDELDFIRNFAEKCHHQKEEAALFPILEVHLITLPKDPLPELLKEHQRGRDIIKSLSAAVDGYAAGDKTQRQRIAELSREYFNLLIEHIRKENTTLIHLMEDRLPANEKLDVAARFEGVEEDLGPDYHKRYVELARRLKDEGKGLAA